MKIRWFSLFMLSALTLGSLIGCGPQATPHPMIAAPPTSPGIPAETAGTNPVTPLPNATAQSPAENNPDAVVPTQGTTNGELPQSINLAKQDLARRLKVPVDSITVTAVIGQEFSTAAFQCKASKERIAKDDPLAEITGFSILLSVSGRGYEYHASGSTVLFCQPLP
jgi:hypothetical protein